MHERVILPPANQLYISPASLEFNLEKLSYPPASEASRELANLTERKNPHAPVYVVKKFVRLLQTLTPSYLGIGRFYHSLWPL